MLGGSFGLPHALTHAILLPHVVAFNRGAAAEAMRVVATALGAADAEGLAAFNRQLGLPASLRALGLQAEDIPRAADLAMQTPYPNPRSVTRDDVLGILRAAFAGT